MTENTANADSEITERDVSNTLVKVSIIYIVFFFILFFLTSRSPTKRTSVN